MRYVLIAGEPSGDKLGAALMTGLSTLDPNARFDGVGGAHMTAAGLTSRFAMSELSLMGLWEVLPKYRHLKRRVEELAQEIARQKPDALITIDSPDFCLRVARRARALWPGLRTIHYVAPSVWAWRPGRAAKMAPFIDHVLALLPFEPPLMRAAGMGCDFVGHPVVAEPQATPAEAAAFRDAHDIAKDAPLLLLLAGSRRSEVSRLAPRFIQAARGFVARHPGARVVAPTLPVVADLLRLSLGPDAVLIEAEADKRAAFAAADLALAASGTVSLELAAAHVPMVIGYDMAPLSRMIISRMMRVDTVTLVNLVSDTRAVPELLGRACTPDALLKALTDVWRAPEAQYAAMAETMRRLGAGGAPPGLRAARAVLDVIG